MSIATHVSPSLVGLHVPRRWSGRRGSNPRPTAWKAVTLPLSYSRLRDPCALRYGGQARVFPPPSARTARPAAYPLRLPQPNSTVGVAGLPAAARRRPLLVPLRRAEAGGEGRIRTSEAARATDLQSVAFDRSATSPTFCRRSATRPATRPPASAWGHLLITKPHDS